MRCLRILNGIHRRIDAGEAVPTDLAQLGLPAEAVVDPFTDAPLILKATPAGWLIYSTGADRHDDGGVFVDHRDVGVGPLPTPKDAD